MYSIGMDTGSANGAVAIIDSKLNIILLDNLPYYIVENKSKKLSKLKLNKETQKFEQAYRSKKWLDYKALGDLLSPYKNKPLIYTVERVFSKEGEGEASSFHFGTTLGILWGLYSYLNPKYFSTPQPSVWKTEMGLDSDKDKSIKMAEDIFKCNLRDYKKKGKVDDLAEALLIALYGLIKYEEDKKERRSSRSGKSKKS